MNSFLESADEEAKSIFFDSIRRYDTLTFSKCLNHFNVKIMDFIDDQNMNGINIFLNNKIIKICF